MSSLLPAPAISTTCWRGSLRRAAAASRSTSRQLPRMDKLLDAHPVAVAYAYELRRRDEIASTGRLTVEEEIEPGDELTLVCGVARVEELGLAKRRAAARPT